MANAEEPTSMEHVKKSELFPKKKLVSDDQTLRVPFPLLTGEFPEFLGRTADGVIALSNFRLLIRYKDSFINIPLGLVESLELRDIFYLTVYCKDATVVRCAFSTNETGQDWFKRLSMKTAQPKNLRDIFAFSFHAWCNDNMGPEQVLEGCCQLCNPGTENCYSFTKELERMKFDLKEAWRYTEINRNFELCSSYPQEHIVPKSIRDEDLKKVAGYRAIQRFPSVVWRNQKNGAVLVRSSQPELGWFGWRNTEDETLLSAIPLACAKNPGSSNKRPHYPDDGTGSESSSQDEDLLTETGVDVIEPRKMLIIDCRSYGAAVANRAKGGGVECPEYYPTCEIQFMSLANIHTIRKSFVALRSLCSGGQVDQASWLSGLENTKWLHHMSSLLKAASLVASVNDSEGRPVLVHCSDGWDRTPQVISLAELQLDPYYRTVEGFQVLVEREWLDFGHKFADRCGSGISTDDINERCPVFLQWLECVYQITKQFPCQFQFNEAFLVKLVQHTYSCMFGTFLCNTKQERQGNSLDQNTASVWSLLCDKKFVNKLYSPNPDPQVIYPKTHMRNLKLWTSVYLSYNCSSTSPEDTTTQQNAPIPEGIEPTNLQKARSCENLLTMTDYTASPSRRKSDPNITLETSIGDQAAKLLKEAMATQDGDTSGSSESMRSTENISINGHANGVEESTDEKHASQHLQVSVNGNKTDSDNVEGCAENQLNTDSTKNPVSKGELVNDNAEINSDLQNGEIENEDSGSSSSLSNGVKELIDEIVNGVSEHINVSSEHVNGESEPLNSVSMDQGRELILDHSVTNGDSGRDNLLGENDTVYGDTQNGIEMENGTDADSLSSGSYHSVKMSSKEQLVLGSKRVGLFPPSVESSTDTITDDDRLRTCQHSPPMTVNNGHSDIHDGQPQALCDKNSINKLKTMERTSSISTSTSDLTDSYVGSDLKTSQQDFQQQKLKLRCVLAQASLNGNTNGCSKGVVNGNSSFSPPHYPSPVSPQSRNSTCPPTPGTSESKSIDTPVQRQLSGVGRQLDVDWLTIFVDPVQQRIEQIQAKYDQEVNSLQHRVAYLESILNQHASACNGEARCNLDIKVGIESPGNSDMHSIQSNYSNAASDASWDQMEDPEINVALWVPDHIVTHCADCNVEFSLIKRKHHCRNCGKIFCHNCCKEYMPLPHQMVHTAERVCRPCSRMLGIQLSKSVMEFENGISEQPSLAAAASN